MDQKEDLNYSFEEIEDEEISKNIERYSKNNLKSQELMLEWESKIDVSTIKLDSESRFPLKIFNSDYFQKSFENFQYEYSKVKV